VQQGNAKKSGAATAPDVQNARKRINVATNLKPTRFLFPYHIARQYAGADDRANLD
jgi:hypothetical protein